jgi:hypothetical protein
MKKNPFFMALFYKKAQHFLTFRVFVCFFRFNRKYSKKEQVNYFKNDAVSDVLAPD